MLVLSRKLNESILIDGRIAVTVVSVHGYQVRLGIEAPKDVPVLRKELVDDDPLAEHRFLLKVFR